ncbi:hypothetical protein Vadar_009850 [Vaccinium darrowii]|uniref:Uncharacterized protein n=1 Tax=Vaccinium darrowii TaxID=229202 RepID=A0ACB7XHK2_9ERIC|nr:hypothetical protein Vadar_009850 [Vaccinium darrowii]
MQYIFSFTKGGAKLLLSTAALFLSSIFKWSGMEIVLDKAAHSSVKGLDFSPDGKFLVSEGTDGPGRIWDGTSSIPVASLPRKNVKVEALGDGNCFTEEGELKVHSSIPNFCFHCLNCLGSQDMDCYRPFKIAWTAIDYRHKAHLRRGLLFVVKQIIAISDFRHRSTYKSHDDQPIPEKLIGATVRLSLFRCARADMEPHVWSWTKETNLHLLAEQIA